MDGLKIMMEESEHEWQLDSKGKPDDFAYTVDPEENSFMGHNGYRCIKCGYSFCEHCVRANWEEFEHECK